MAISKADEKIDICGLICPYTLMETRDKLKQMARGQVLEVLCDYEPAAKETIPNFCQRKGYTMEVVQDAPEKWRLLITKTD